MTEEGKACIAAATALLIIFVGMVSAADSKFTPPAWGKQGEFLPAWGEMQPGSRSLSDFNRRWKGKAVSLTAKVVSTNYSTSRASIRMEVAGAKATVVFRRIDQLTLDVGDVVKLRAVFIHCAGGSSPAMVIKEDPKVVSVVKAAVAAQAPDPRTELMEILKGIRSKARGPKLQNKIDRAIEIVRNLR